MNGEIFYSLKEAQVVIEQWQCRVQHGAASLGTRITGHRRPAACNPFLVPTKTTSTSPSCDVDSHCYWYKISVRSPPAVSRRKYWPGSAQLKANGFILTSRKGQKTNSGTIEKRNTRDYRANSLERFGPRGVPLEPLLESGPHAAQIWLRLTRYQDAIRECPLVPFWRGSHSQASVKTGKLGYIA